MREKLEYGLFLGCVIPLRLPWIETAARKVLGKMELTLADMKEASCCPDPMIFKSLDIKSWLTLAARNLSLAENMGLTNIMTLCSGCSATLCEANKYLKERSALKNEVNKTLSTIGLEYKGNITVKHFLKVLRDDVGLEKIRSLVEKPLENLKIATHPGCHLLRPSDVLQFDDPIKPMVLDELVNVLGAHAIDYQHKTLCCGAGVRGVELELTQSLIKDKLTDITNSGGEGIVVACPTCFLQYDVGQIELKKDLKTQIPVFYYIQLLGLTMGLESGELGMNLHKVRTESLVAKITGVS